VCQQLSARDLMSAAWVNRYWYHHTNKLMFWKSISRHTGLLSEQAYDHKIIAQLEQLAPFFFSSDYLLYANKQEYAQQVVIIVKKCGQDFECENADIIKLFIAMNHAIMQTQTPFSTPVEAAVFLPFLQFMLKFNVPFNQAATMMVDFYQKGATLNMGMMCGLEDLAPLESLYKHCDNDFHAMFHLIGDSMFNLAFGADSSMFLAIIENNPANDLLKSIEYLNNCFEQPESDDFKELSETMGEIKEGNAKVKAFDSPDFLDHMIRQGLKKVAFKFFDKDDNEQLESLVCLVKRLASKYQSGSVVVMEFFAAMRLVFNHKDELVTEENIEKLFSFYINVARKCESDPEKLEHLMLEFKKRGGLSKLDLNSNNDSQFCEWIKMVSIEKAKQELKGNRM